MSMRLAYRSCACLFLLIKHKHTHKVLANKSGDSSDIYMQNEQSKKDQNHDIGIAEFLDRTEDRLQNSFITQKTSIKHTFAA